jgi:hypothetical protein
MKQTHTPEGYSQVMPGYKSHKAQVQGRLLSSLEVAYALPGWANAPSRHASLITAR